MKRLPTSLLNFLLACGILFVFGGFLLFVFAIEHNHDHFFQFWPFFITISGMLITYFSVAFFKKSHLLFTGIMLGLSGCFSVFVTRDITTLGWHELWPVFLFICAISLFLSCIYRFKKIRPNYFVPSMVMVFLGIVFLLFSLDIIKMSFASFVFITGPFLLFFGGIAVVVLYFVQSTHRELVIPEEDADNED
ncbi:MAG: hypothetical protein MJ181_09290 [Treponema sp.]|nr:hypothetical protein [Treponema sp.]